jgi:vacuolar-type H+-ATPase subunit I/STV1
MSYFDRIRLNKFNQNHDTKNGEFTFSNGNEDSKQPHDPKGSWGANSAGNKVDAGKEPYNAYSPAAERPKTAQQETDEEEKALQDEQDAEEDAIKASANNKPTKTQLHQIMDSLANAKS